VKNKCTCPTPHSPPGIRWLWKSRGQTNPGRILRIALRFPDDHGISIRTSGPVIKEPESENCTQKRLRKSVVLGEEFYFFFAAAFFAGAFFASGFFAAAFFAAAIGIPPPTGKGYIFS
jgi:hypothetical protein